LFLIIQKLNPLCLYSIHSIMTIVTIPTNNIHPKEAQSLAKSAHRTPFIGREKLERLIEKHLLIQDVAASDLRIHSLRDRSS